MSQTPIPAGTTKEASAFSGGESAPGSDRIILISFPKVIFLYPIFIYSLLAGLFMLFVETDAVSIKDINSVVIASVFLLVLMVNLVVLSFDFPRGTSLTLFLFFAAILFGALLLFQYKPDLIPFFGNIVTSFHPVANSTFYFLTSAILGLLFAVVFVLTKFDYWEVRPNELLHHHGFLSDLKRYPAPNLRVDKEINDVFEYVLLRSGRLILHPSGEARAVVLDNVLFIDKKEFAVTQMLGALQVQVRKEQPAEQ